MVNEPVWPPADMTPVMALMARYDTFPPPAPSGNAADYRSWSASSAIENATTRRLSTPPISAASSSST